MLVSEPVPSIQCHQSIYRIAYSMYLVHSILCNAAGLTGGLPVFGV
jgi:hypothetical protein